MKSKLSDNIPPPRRVVPCAGSWWANNRCCARLKNSAARRDAQKVERREAAGTSPSQRGRPWKNVTAVTSVRVLGRFGGAGGGGSGEGAGGRGEGQTARWGRM